MLFLVIRIASAGNVAHGKSILRPCLIADPTVLYIGRRRATSIAAAFWVRPCPRRCMKYAILGTMSSARYALVRLSNHLTLSPACANFLTLAYALITPLVAYWLSCSPAAISASLPEPSTISNADSSISSLTMSEVSSSSRSNVLPLILYEPSLTSDLASSSAPSSPRLSALAADLASAMLRKDSVILLRRATFWGRVTSKPA